MNTDKLLRMQDVMDITGCKRSKLYALVAGGEFPRPVKIGNSAHWPESRVRQWITDRIAESDRGEA